MKALVLVDIQNDFLPGGALAVPHANEILPIVNSLLNYPFDIIVATKDYHPHKHISFAETHNKAVGETIISDDLVQILWPTHCVQGTPGAEFGGGWDSDKVNEVVLKGTDTKVDSYSTFFDNHQHKSTGLEQHLLQHNITDVYIAGLATDYCVLYSVLDSLKLGFNTFVITDACRGVNLHPGDSEKAFESMKAHGAHLITSKEIHRESIDL